MCVWRRRGSRGAGREPVIQGGGRREEKRTDRWPQDERDQGQVDGRRLDGTARRRKLTEHPPHGGAIKVKSPVLGVSLAARASPAVVRMPES